MYIVIANIFVNRFTGVFTKTEHSQVLLLDRSVPYMEDIVVSISGACDRLENLNG